MGLNGLEPSTSRLSGVCSNQLSYRPRPLLIFILKNKKLFFKSFTTEDDIFLRKEVIHPHLPVGIPCYDLTPIINPTLDSSLFCKLGYWFRVLSTFMVWRAVCTNPENVFTTTCWFAITSDSDFMKSSCRLQSELRLFFWDLLKTHASATLCNSHCITFVAQVIRGMMIWRNPHLPPIYHWQSH